MLERIGGAAYRLDLPAESLVHPVFHVSQLKPFTPDHTPVFSELPNLPDLAKQDVVPKAILDQRLVKKGGKAIPQVRVKWSNLPSDSATWEDWNVLNSRFPGALPGGPASSLGGGDVTMGVEGVYCYLRFRLCNEFAYSM